MNQRNPDVTRWFLLEMLTKKSSEEYPMAPQVEHSGSPHRDRLFISPKEWEVMRQQDAALDISRTVSRHFPVAAGVDRVYDEVAVMTPREYDRLRDAIFG